MEWRLNHVGQMAQSVQDYSGYTQEELAIKIHVVRQTISKWEKGVSQTKRY